ncbi:AAA family ATPase [Mucilaginibacter sp.]|uniref:AAA family ATPase n=1 Tax=Mucilaginibacter sp. TaxID=1882438 RepID=UPI0032667C07
MDHNHTAERPDYIESIRAEVRGFKSRPARLPAREYRQPPDPEEGRHLFTVFTGNRWMELGQREPGAKMLFGEFWHQNELCILFADTNVGKSVLAVQIGNSVARGKAIAPFALQAPPAKVLYIDFELTTLQFYQRYTHTQGNDSFNDNFFRAEFNIGNNVMGTYGSTDDEIIAGIEYKIKLVKANVLIIDNISCLRGGTENAAVALGLMKRLKELKTRFNLSILVLAHTPKRRNPGWPLSADELHGSKILINLADSALAIGTSSAQQHLRYLKQIKQRSTAQVYGEDNVCLCRIIKHHDFLQMQFEGNSHERLHLRTRAPLDKELLATRVAHLAGKGYSQRRIGIELCISVGLVNKLMPKPPAGSGAVITPTAS